MDSTKRTKPEPPLFKGGQGRDAEDIEDSGVVMLMLGVAAVAMGLVFALARWQGLL